MAVLKKIISRNFRIISWLSAFGLVGLVYVYVVEFRYFSNTIEITQLIYKSLFVAGVIGSILAWRISKTAKDLTGKMQCWAVSLSLSTLFAPLVGSLSNRLLSPHPIEMQQMEFFQEKPYAASPLGFIEGEKIEPEGYFIFVIYREKLERFKSESPRFAGTKQGTIIEIPMKKGLFGYEVVIWESEVKPERGPR